MSTNPELEGRALEHRQEWLPALAVLDLEELAQAVDPLLSHYEIEHQALPEDGLGLLKVRDGAFGQPFYLGEFPVASAHVVLRNGRGEGYAGAAHYLGDSADKAIRLAVCDAVLAHDLPGAVIVQALARTGLNRLRARQRRRSAMLEKTRVDFDLLASTKGGGDVD